MFSSKLATAISALKVALHASMTPRKLACVADRRREGKGSKGAREYRREQEGTACKDAIVFLVFFRPPDERKNPDWSDFMNYSIRRSDWSATCHSRESVFSHSFIQHIE